MRTWKYIVVLVMTALLKATAGEKPSVEFPIEFHDGLIWVQVQARDSAEPLNFILDSGAGVSVINLPTARKLGLKTGRRVGVQGVHATASGYWPLHLPVESNTVPLPDKLLAVDLNALSEACECRVDGLLGADFFSNRVVQINFEARKLSMVSALPALAKRISLPLRMDHNALLVPACINDCGTNWLRLDTGCAGSLHWVASNGKLKPNSRMLAVALTKVSIPLAETTVRLGTMQFDSVPTGMHSKEIFAGESGLLGNGLLSRFKSVTVNAAAGEVLLEEPSAAGN